MGGHQQPVVSTKERAPSAMRQHQGRLARWEADSSTEVEYIQGEAYDELRFGRDASTFTQNSVLLVPNLLTLEERTLLITAAERRACEGDRAHAPKLRISIFDRPSDPKEGIVRGGLGRAAGDLWAKVLNERVLPMLAAELPGEFGSLFPAGSAHDTMEYLGSEPTVNRCWC